MALDNNRVLLGTPDQTTTGAVATAPLGTTLPTDASTPLTSDWTDGGYISEDGMKFSADISTGNIREWNGSKIRTYIDEMNGDLNYTEVQTDKTTLERVFGKAYVETIAATATHGTQHKVSIGNHMPEMCSWVVNMKDGNNRMRIVVPKGQVTKFEPVSFVRGEAVKWNITISCYDDGTGNCMYLYTDDGEKIGVPANED